MSTLDTKWDGYEFSMGELIGTLSSNLWGNGYERYVQEPPMERKFMLFLTFFSLWPNVFRRTAPVDRSALSFFWLAILMLFVLCRGTLWKSSPATSRYNCILFTLWVWVPRPRPTLIFILPERQQLLSIKPLPERSFTSKTSCSLLSSSLWSPCRLKSLKS